jgi:hypothetical protein
VEPENTSPVGRGRRPRRSAPTKAVLAAVALGTAAVLGLGVWATIAASMSAGPASEPQADQIEVFTFVESGIVYVDPDTAEIIWRNAQRVSKTIGKDPWRNPEPTDADVGPVRPWNDDRQIVGNPGHNVVSWVETADGRRGDIVVVEASTGKELARAPVDGPPGDSVVISSVDDEAVYFAVVEQNWPFPDVDSDFVRVWRYAAGEQPERGPRDSTVYFNDFSAGVSAIYVQTGVLFERTDLVTLSVASGADTARTDFGGALSPDGRFWYGAESSKVFETATGKAFEIPTAPEREYAWTGATELVLTVCDGGARECQTHTCDAGRPGGVVCAPGLRWPESAEGSPFGLCAPYGLACGSRMPVT